MFRSKAGQGTVQVSSLSDGTYTITKIEAGKPKMGFQNPLLSIEGVNERVYVHPTKLGDAYCRKSDTPGVWEWKIPQNFEGFNLVVVSGGATISIPSAPPEPPKQTNGAW